MTQLNRVLSFCTKYGFVRSPKPEDSVEHYKLGPLGDLLKEKILQEWTHADDFVGENVPPFTITSPSFNDHKDFQEKISVSKLLTSKKLPFIIKLKTSDRFSSFSKLPELENTEKQTVLKKYVFVPQGKSTQYFSEWQQRRIFWWKKMATFPGRFQASDEDQNENTQHLQILVKFPWGTHCVEIMTLIKDMSWINSDSNFLPESDRAFKKKAHVLTSTVGLENAAFSVLLDAYDETTSISPRELMRFNHKMAPYQINFALLPHAKSACQDLRELADFLAQQLSNKGIIIKHPHLLEKFEHPHFDDNDHLGIPYTVVMQDPCLQNGIIGLRCRDTTLQEQVHVTDLRKYVLQLFKHY